MNATVLKLLHSKLVWIAAVFIVGSVVLLTIPRHTNVPAKDQHTLDSLSVTRPTFTATQDTLVLRETTFVHQVDTLVRTANALIAAGTVLRKRADAIAVTAQKLSDTASLWHSAYIARTMEADTLRAAVDTLKTALTLERSARTLADQRATNATQRLTISEDLNARLAKDIQTASECRFLWMRCPSRGVIALTSVAVGVTAGVVADHAFVRRP